MNETKNTPAAELKRLAERTAKLQADLDAARSKASEARHALQAATVTKAAALGTPGPEDDPAAVKQFDKAKAEHDAAESRVRDLEEQLSALEELASRRDLDAQRDDTRRAEENCRRGKAALAERVAAGVPVIEDVLVARVAELSLTGGFPLSPPEIHLLLTRMGVDLVKVIREGKDLGRRIRAGEALP